MENAHEEDTTEIPEGTDAVFGEIFDKMLVEMEPLVTLLQPESRDYGNDSWTGAVEQKVLALHKILVEELITTAPQQSGTQNTLQSTVDQTRRQANDASPILLQRRNERIRRYRTTL